MQGTRRGHVGGMQEACRGHRGGMQGPFGGMQGAFRRHAGARRVSSKDHTCPRTASLQRALRWDKGDQDEGDPRNHQA